MVVALSVSLEITKISLSANATRCRNWSGPVSTVCHHSDSSQLVGVLADRHSAGRGVGMLASGVSGVLNCCVIQASTPVDCTCRMVASEGPKVA